MKSETGQKSLIIYYGLVPLLLGVEAILTINLEVISLIKTKIEVVW
jgi:hypothetical protein